MIYQKLNLKNGRTIDENIFQHIENGIYNASLGDDYSIHISFDDVVACLTNLSNNTYNSLFDEPFFGWLKELHTTYGAKFSLYVYNLTTLASVPATYKDDFYNARHWLKLGLHSKQSGYNYASTTYDDAQTDWNLLIENIVRITGSYESVDRIPRLHNFAGSAETVTGMRDCICGALGFLGADTDARLSYHMTDEQKAILNKQSVFLDTENGVIIFKTNYRAEFLSATDGMYEKMESFLSDASLFKPFVWFTHEPYVYSNSALTNYYKNVEDVCKFAFEYNIPFVYPQNKIGIHPKTLIGTSNDGSTDTGNSGNTASVVAGFYISNTDGTEVESGSWLHTDLIDITKLANGTDGFCTSALQGHAKVANIAFYSSNDLSSYISSVTYTANETKQYTAEEIQELAPDGTAYVNFSTHATYKPLTVTVS